MSITKLQGKVAAVLNDQQLVINLGKHDGVTRGMRFAVYGAEPIVVRDPDSGEELDRLDPEKIRVHVYEIRDRVSVCETYRRLPLAALDRMHPLRERLVPHQDDLTQLPEPNPAEGYVRIGDRVVQVTEADEAALSG